MKTANRTYGSPSVADKFDKWASGLDDVTSPEMKKAGWITFGVAVVGTFGFWLYRRGKKSQEEAAQSATASVAPPQ